MRKLTETAAYAAGTQALGRDTWRKPLPGNGPFAACRLGGEDDAVTAVARRAEPRTAALLGRVCATLSIYRLATTLTLARLGRPARRPNSIILTPSLHAERGVAWQRLSPGSLPNACVPPPAA